jgi:hypothetical protein
MILSMSDASKLKKVALKVKIFVTKVEKCNQCKQSHYNCTCCKEATEEISGIWKL